MRYAMGKQRRKRETPAFVEHLRERLGRIAVNVSVSVLLVVVISLLVQAFLYGSDYFRLRTVEMKGTPLDAGSISYINGQVLTAYKGKNIFTIDLRAIARYLAGRFPDAREATARLALPDKIVLQLAFRRPVALVHGPKYYPVDDEGIILTNANDALFKYLPVIEGVEMRPAERKAARGAPYRNLQIALELLQEIKNARFMAQYGVTSVSAGDAKDLAFTMKNGVQVKIGYENFKARLETLAKVLKDPRLVADRIEYIDVRFKDVAIGPREV
jgi:cell division septal protein FtsQ